MTTPVDQSAVHKPTVRPAPYDPTQKQKSADKTSRIPIKVVQAERLKKPDWIRVKAAAPGSRFYDIKKLRSEEHTSELQSLMRISYAVFCLKKKKTYISTHHICIQLRTSLML